MALMYKLIPLFIITLMLSSCSILQGVRTVYIKDAKSVRLRQDVKNAKIWTPTDEGVVESRMTIPEGWYCSYVD